MSIRSISPSVALLLCVLAGCASNGDDVKLTKSKGEPDPSSSRAGNTKAAGTPKLALDELDAAKLPKLGVGSAAFSSMAPIPATYSDYGEKSSPPLKIVGVPNEAKSLVVIVDDPDSKDPKPFIHWVLYNLPANITELRTAVPATGQVRQLMNAKQGMNSAGRIGYFGPKPPAGDPPHHYHFQVFALDAMLPLEQSATEAEVVMAAKGHVLAAGELVGTFAKPTP